MNNKIFIPLAITTVLFGGYFGLENVQASQPIQIAQSVWKPFSYTEGGFRILLPGTPDEQRRTIDTPRGGIPMRIFSVLRGNEALYGVAYADLPANGVPNSRNVNEFLRGEAASFAEGFGGRLLSQRTISLGGFPGREFRVQLSDGRIGIGKSYIVNERFYQVFVLTGQERNLTKTIEGFFKSFQLVGNGNSPRNAPPEDLNAQLKQAFCSQNWSQAIKVIDRMLVVESDAESRSQLMAYRQRLQGLASSESDVPSELLADCRVGE
ncbi:MULTISPECIES: hypothetical protein [unclassified Coleofasciculus]|uniref:hypothetical protein n=1 Tax=unclassified Coleofasciculus TaxID=2692782 RepID=UPI00187EC051|nr:MULTISPECIES: hypothetical protein [unclassified Coleofasciculus]MBE9130235.1 hypothetical protein [Coleofasciculus sp. LEGE 07081]MBE9149797.1 hypothetical protein [Coleofasciculus sp. LEGE 07092]